jgi:YHS domain-containing protein/putative intracellular protease/amidase
MHNADAASARVKTTLHEAGATPGRYGVKCRRYVISAMAFHLHTEAMMNSLTRRELAALLGAAAATTFPRRLAAEKSAVLRPPEKGSIPVAFLISANAVVIDFCGPWSIFETTSVPSRQAAPFQLYTVAETADPVVASSGMKLIPAYTFQNAPDPKVIVIPAQKGSDAMVEWIKAKSQQTDMVMSVCTGAFLLARTGLLSGKSATTHHSSYGQFGMTMKDIRLKRGFRFVDEGNVATSGGLTSGIDLALHVVERYYGREVAANTAYYAEYQGQGWKDSSGAANSEYAKPNPNMLEDPICGMAVDSKAVNSSTYKGKTIYFCTRQCKNRFDADPEAALQALER